MSNLKSHRVREHDLAILTNARAADQRSMIGYGELLLETARQSGHEVFEYRPASLFGRIVPEHAPSLQRKIANNLDRFIVTPPKLAGKGVDIVHVVDPGNVVYLPLIRYRNSIATVHDMIPYLARDGKLPGWRPTRTGRWLMDRIIAQLEKVDHIVCVSNSTKRDLLRYVDIPEERVSVIRNAVFQPMKPAIPEACAELRARLGLPMDAVLILHVGQNFYKNREAVLDVAANVRKERPDVHLVMVGALTPELKAQAQRMSLFPALHVLSQVARDDMPTLYTTASALLFPSHYEGFGLPVLEAQMCGTPVVCSNAGSLLEVANDAALTASPWQIEEFSQLILSTLNNKGIKTGSTSATNESASSKWKQQYLSLYERHR